MNCKIRHRELHRALDELLACFIDASLKVPALRHSSILDQPIRKLVEFSYGQFTKPECDDNEQSTKTL